METAATEMLTRSVYAMTQARKHIATSDPRRVQRRVSGRPITACARSLIAASPWSS